ncbi:MAG: cupin [Ilumatobacteraceae bacterium]
MESLPDPTASVVVRTTEFGPDLAMLTDGLGFRVEMIFPADRPSTAVVSAHGVRLRLEAAETSAPITIRLDGVQEPRSLPGGSRVEPAATDSLDPTALPVNRPSLWIDRDDGSAGVGRAGMRYRDLLPDRWGGRFISSLISIADGGPVPDYVHFHRIRFQLIFVKEGWVRVVYEDQGDPFVLQRGDCVIQPPEIRHRVLESSPGLEVVEIGCPAEHETRADWTLDLPNGVGDPTRRWDGQRFVRHIADGAPYLPWHRAGWEYRETGVADATDGLAGVRVARPGAEVGSSQVGVPIGLEHEFAQLVVLKGEVAFAAEGRSVELLSDGDAVAIPPGTSYELLDPTPDCELLDVTLPASP